MSRNLIQRLWRKKGFFHDNVPKYRFCTDKCLPGRLDRYWGSFLPKCSVITHARPLISLAVTEE
jgi:hypothetical protein